MPRIQCFSHLVLMLATASVASAQFPQGNPINAVIPKTSWTVELEDVLTIPNSAGQVPRMEDMTFGGQPGLAYVIDQRGPIWSFDPSQANPTPSLFFDIYSVVQNANIGIQTGLRGLAFHPDFNNSGTDGFRKFYTAHSRNAFAAAVGNPKAFFSPPGINHESVVGEWTMNANGTVNGGSYREVVRVGQPLDDHNIGQISFNPNASQGDADYGNLYIALGDGGGAGNPNNTAQDISTTTPNSGGMGFPHGSMLRINPIASGGNPFEVPTDNPFVGQANTIQEVWAYGLRNPHKFSWDTEGQGIMLISDIGQSNVEEINLGQAGANYGWDEREGTFDVLNTGIVQSLPANHPSDGFTYPVIQHDHDLNNNNFRDHLFATVGGPVYRGDDLPQLRGRYFFGEFSEESVIYSVGVEHIIQRDDFSDLQNLSDGHLAPFEEVRLTRNGVETSLLDIVRAETGNFSLNRSDIRLAAGPDGEFYVLNKRDGVIRRFAAVDGLLAGDFNEDGVVDAADYTVWRDGLGNRYSPSDYDVWAGNFGATLPASSESNSVPEPSALLLGMLACGALARRRA